MTDITRARHALILITVRGVRCKKRLIFNIPYVFRGLGHEVGRVLFVGLGGDLAQ